MTEIHISESQNTLTLIISDNGCGMDNETLKSVTNPFYTTRKTRKVGLGIPLLKLACEQTGGRLVITSKKADDIDPSHGTVVQAYFVKTHIDFTPLGDVISSVTTLIQGHPDRDFLFVHTNGENSVNLDTREIREILEDIPLDTYDVIKWIEENLKEQYSEAKIQIQ